MSVFAFFFCNVLTCDLFFPPWYPIQHFFFAGIGPITLQRYWRISNECVKMWRMCVCVEEFYRVTPLAWEVIWLRRVRHPRGATVRRGRWQDEVVGVAGSVGWYGINGCHWVSCRDQMTDNTSKNSCQYFRTWLSFLHPVSILTYFINYLTWWFHKKKTHTFHPHLHTSRRLAVIFYDVTGATLDYFPFSHFDQSVHSAALYCILHNGIQ